MFLLFYQDGINSQLEYAGRMYLHVQFIIFFLSAVCMVIKVYNRLLNHIKNDNQKQLLKNELQPYVLQYTFYSVEEPRLLILAGLAVYQHTQMTEHH